jgi:hypothetical protein
MKKLNYSKLVIANDDLELVIKSLELLERTTKCEHTKGEANRIAWKLSALLTPEIYEYSDSQLMNI